MLDFKCTCPNCLNKGYIWYAQNDRVFWIEIPKNGSSSIKKSSSWSIKDKKPPHSLLKIPDKKIMQEERINAFVMLRDPHSRFKSLIKFYFIEKGGRWQKGMKYAKSKERIQKEIDLGPDNFLNFLANSRNHLQIHHFNSQTYFIENFMNRIKDAHKAKNKVINLNYVILSKKETFPHFWKEMGRIKSSSSVDESFYQQNIDFFQNFVEKFYRDDIELYEKVLRSEK